jgi:hypothetical protein
MNALQEKEGQTIYRYWSQTLAGVLAWELKLFETHCQAGFKIVEAALRIPGGAKASPDEPGGAAPPPTDEFQRLESLAFERTRKGLAPPREIYEVPYRDRLDWSKFPEWARPIDPELFQDSGHEG